MRIVAPVVLLCVAALSGCDDPCTALARRVCNCELSSTTRLQCITDRITNQQGTVVIDENDKALCSEKLDTCTCASIDENRLDECGFVPEANNE
jgi:hypothetical protein